MPARETLENRTHSTPEIPYSFYECCIPKMHSSVVLHWHDEFEINRILTGRGEFICGDEKLVAQSGDMLFLPPDTLHAAYPFSGEELIYQAMVFDPAMLGMEGKDRSVREYIRPVMQGRLTIQNRIGREETCYEEIKLVVDRIFSYSGLGSNGDVSHAASAKEDLLLKGSLMQLFGLLDYRKSLDLAEENSISYSRLIRPALQYMIENYRENISVERLAKEAGLSKSYFMNCFKKAAGISVMEYLSRHRIAAACQMLTETSLSVAEIAYDCGYNNLSNFNRQFLKQMKCPPRDYRKGQQT